MSFKKSSLLLNTNQNWNNSWSSYCQQEYRSLIQEDLIFQSYFRSIIKDLDMMNPTNMRIYRLNKSIFVDVGIGANKTVHKKIILRLSLFLKDLSKFFEMDVYLALYKVSFIRLLNCGFNIALRIAKLVEKRIKFRSKLIKMLLKKVRDNSKGVYVQCKGRINNVDRAQVDKLYLGSTPLQFLSSYTSYGLTVANTFKGLLSIKVWICK
jgi:ribosomal protein S3